jgi:hypothetical protein
LLYKTCAKISLYHCMSDRHEDQVFCAKSLKLHHEQCPLSIRDCEGAEARRPWLVFLTFVIIAVAMAAGRTGQVIVGIVVAVTAPVTNAKGMEDNRIG